MPAASFMTRRLTKEFIEKNGRSPTKDEFIAIQHEAVNTLINNNSVYGILRQGGTKMSENASKGKPTEEQVVFLSRDIKAIYTPKPFGECEHPDTAASRILPGSLKGRYNFKIMTKKMHDNFVKQGKKFVTLVGSKEFDSLDVANIDFDGDIVIDDGQKYAVDTSTWRK